MIIDEHTTEIAVRPTLAQLVQNRNHVLLLLDQRQKISEEIEGLMSIIGDSYTVSTIERSRNKDARAYVDKKFWEHLIETSQLSNSMTSKTRNELYQKLDQAPPEFSETEVLQYAESLKHLYGDNALQTIKEVYRQLIGTSYWTGKQEKKNNLRQVEKTFKIRGNIRHNERWKDFCYQENAHGFDFSDLLAACYLLETGIRPTYAQDFRVLAFESFKIGNTIDTPFFTVEAHINGNQTIRWKEEKIAVLNDLNKYGPAENNQLPDPLKKRYKPEHFKV